jgi:hypothetical protein
MTRKGYHQDQPGWLTRDDDKAEAVRYYLSEGSSFSGWIVRSVHNRYSYSDPIPTRAEAVAELLAWTE